MKDKFYAYCILIGLVALIIFYFLFRIRGEKLDVRKCKIEKDLEIDGIVRDYSTNIKDETSTFALFGSSKIYVIPRSSKEMNLSDGDTIKKYKGQHVYFVKRYLFSNGHQLDTFVFDCNTIQ